MGNHSYTPKQKPNRLVWAWGQMCRVDNSSAYLGGYSHDPMEMLYQLWRDGKLHPYIGEAGLRRPTFMEFMWYRDPVTRKRKIGANPAAPLLYANAVVIACLWVLLAYGAPSPGWEAFAITLLIAVPVATVLFSYANYRNQWR